MRGLTHLRRTAAGVAAAIMAASGLVVLNSSPAQAACTPWTVIGVRGTNDGDRASLGKKLPTAVSAFKARKGAANVTTQYVSYRADAWPDWNDGAYRASLKEGKTVLQSMITKRLSACPSTKIALFGYSQGAHVVGDVVVGMSSTQRTKLQGIGLIGDPMFNPELRGGKTGSTKYGGMWQRRASWPSGVFVYNVCNKLDQVCASYNTVQSLFYVLNGGKEHHSYTNATHSPISGVAGAVAIGRGVADRKL